MNLELLVYILFILASIFFKKLRYLPSKGNWIYDEEYEDEKWVKIGSVVVRIIMLLVGIIGLINIIF